MGIDQQTGVIVVPPFGYTHGISLSHAQADAHLMFYLMYFDAVRTLNMNLMVGSPLIFSTELEQLLIQQQIIAPAGQRQHNIEFFDAAYVSECAVQIYDLANSRDGPRYALGSHPDVASHLAGQTLNAVVAVLERCLPCPTPDVPVHELLDFRSRHREDLQRFRLTLAEAFARLGHESVDDAARLFEKRLIEDLRDLDALYEKSKLKFFRVGLRASFQAAGAFGGAALEAFLGESGAVKAIGAVAGASVAAVLEGSILGREGNMFPRDFQYIVTGMREGILASHPAQAFADDVRGLSIKASTVPGFLSEEIMPPSKVGGASFTNIFVG